MIMGSDKSIKYFASTKAVEQQRSVDDVIMIVASWIRAAVVVFDDHQKNKKDMSFVL